MTFTILRTRELHIPPDEGRNPVAIYYQWYGPCGKTSQTTFPGRILVRLGESNVICRECTKLKLRRRMRTEPIPVKKRHCLTKDDLQNGNMVRCQIMRILGERYHGSSSNIIWVAFNQGPTPGCYDAYCPFYGRVFIQPFRAASVPTTTVQMLRSINHRNILEIFDFGLILTTDPKIEIRFMTITEWCPNRTLFELIHKERRVFSIDVILRICTQVIDALIYLQGKDVEHCNLTSHTMFLLDDYTVKLGCFSIAQPQKPLWSWWSAPEERHHVPEAFRFSQPTNLAYADIYAFGIILYELLVQMLPYNNVYNNMYLMYQIENGHILPELPRRPNCTPLSLAKTIVWEQLNSCLKFESCDRPSLRDIKKILADLRKVTPKFLIKPTTTSKS